MIFFNKYKYYILATLLSVMTLIGGLMNYSYGVIKPQQEAYTTISYNKWVAAVISPGAIKQKSFFSKGFLGGRVNLFMLSHTDSTSITSTALAETDKRAFKKIDHPMISKPTSSVVKSEIDGNYVVRGMYHGFIDDKAVTFVTEKRLIDIVSNNIVSILFPLLLPLAFFITAYFSNTQEKLKDKEIRDIKSADKKSEEAQKKSKDIMKLVNKFMLYSRTDSEGKLTEVNAKFCDISGYLEHELYMEDYETLGGSHNEEGLFEEMWSTMSAGLVWVGSITNKKKDTDERYNISSASAKAYDGGYHMIAVDITEVMKQKELLEKKNRILDHSAYIARHDIRNPLIVLNKYFKKFESKLTKETLLSIKGTGSWNIIIKAMDQLNIIYEGLYDFTSMVRENSVLRKSEIDIHASLKGYFQNTAYGNQIVLDESMPKIYVNEGLVSNAIDNLVRNGLKYNESKNKKIEIYSEGLDMIVKDNGIGMTREQYERYCVPHIRGSEDEEGSGLGLSIANIIFEKHGWGLTARKGEIGTSMIIKNIFA